MDAEGNMREDLEQLALADGDYTFLARACNLWGECSSPSDPFEHTKVTPGKPATPSLVAE